jgi:hypothetical protein
MRGSDGLDGRECLGCAIRQLLCSAIGVSSHIHEISGQVL